MRDMLIKYGEALYGPRFATDLARDLGVSDRTMRRWLAGDTNPPEGILADLKRLARERIEALKSI